MGRPDRGSGGLLAAAGSQLGEGFLKKLGQILFADGGGTVSGSAIDNAAGQYRSRLDQIKTALWYGSWGELLSYFVHGDFRTFRVADADGEIACPGVPGGSLEVDNMLQMLGIYERRVSELRESAEATARRAGEQLSARREKVVEGLRPDDPLPETGARLPLLRLPGRDDARNRRQDR